MEIKIDTSKDSAEHIQHMIDFLTKFIAAQGLQENTSTDTPTPSPSMFGMFGDDAAASSSAPEPQPDNEAQKFSLEPY